MKPLTMLAIASLLLTPLASAETETTRNAAEADGPVGYNCEMDLSTCWVWVAHQYFVIHPREALPSAAAEATAAESASTNGGPVEYHCDHDSPTADSEQHETYCYIMVAGFMYVIHTSELHHPLNIDSASSASATSLNGCDVNNRFEVSCTVGPLWLRTCWMSGSEPCGGHQPSVDLAATSSASAPYAAARIGDGDPVGYGCELDDDLDHSCWFWAGGQEFVVHFPRLDELASTAPTDSTSSALFRGFDGDEYPVGWGCRVEEGMREHCWVWAGPFMYEYWFEDEEAASTDATSSALFRGFDGEEYPVGYGCRVEEGMRRHCWVWAGPFMYEYWFEDEEAAQAQNAGEVALIGECGENGPVSVNCRYFQESICNPPPSSTHKCGTWKDCTLWINGLGCSSQRIQEIIGP